MNISIETFKRCLAFTQPQKSADIGVNELFDDSDCSHDSNSQTGLVYSDEGFENPSVMLAAVFRRLCHIL